MKTEMTVPLAQEVVSIEDMPTIEPRGESTFRDLGILSDHLLANVKAMGIKMPTEVWRRDEPFRLDLCCRRFLCAL